MFDREQLQQLRNDCTLAAIDFSRASLEAADNGGYVVRLSPARVDISVFEGEVPTRIDARSAADAEGHMLRWLLKIQRAERRIVRTGTCHWTPEQICRRPFEPGELAAYKERVAHQRKIADLQAQLSEAISRRAALERTEGSAEELVTRYGLAPASKPVELPVPADDVPVALVSGKSQKRPARGASK